MIVVNDGTAFSQPTRDLIGSLGAMAVKTKGGLDARAEWLLFLDDDDLIAVIYWQAVARYIDAHFQSTDLAYGFYRASSQSDRTAMQRVAAAQTMFHSQLQEGTSLRSNAGLGFRFWVPKALFQKVSGINCRVAHEFGYRFLP